MALVTANGVPVIGGTIVMPLVGVWTADLVLDQVDGSGFAVGTSVQIVAGNGGITMQGTVAPNRTGDFLDAVHVRVLGGAGGMAKTVKPRSFIQPGATARDVVNGIVGDAGESLSTTAEAMFLSQNLVAWSTMAQRASTALEMLISVVAPADDWRILADGTLWVGPETWPQSSPLFQMLESNPADASFLLGVESPSVVPGYSVPDVGNVNRVEHQISAKHIRTRVWVDMPSGRGIKSSTAAIVAQQVAHVDYFAFYKFSVSAQSSDLTTVDVNPSAPNDAKLAALSKVPVRAGSGIKMQFAQGSTVLLGWDGGNPTLPFVAMGLSADAVQRIQVAGNTDAARKSDPVNMGTWTHLPAAGAGVTPCKLIWVPPGGGAPVTDPSGQELDGSIKSGSSLVGLG